jgi:hypothetical protein
MAGYIDTTEHFARRLFARWRRGLVKEAHRFATEVLAERFRGRPALEAHNFGRGMLGSFRVVEVGEDFDSWSITVGTMHPGAKLQEFGGQVTASGGGMLPIPQKAALTPSGAKRYPSPLRQTLSGREVFVQKDEKGRLWLMERVEGKEAPVALARLVRSVNVPARLGFFQAWKDQEPARVKVAERALAEALPEPEGI